MARRCKKSWLDSYLEYTYNQESPTMFHQWVGLSLISAALGRHVVIPRVKYQVYPNLFVILIAGSAKCRKSVSMGIGIDLLRSLESPPMIFAQKLTTEALIQALEEAKEGGKDCAGIICSSELSVFMGSDAIKSGIIPALTDLYDSPKEWVYHTRGRGKEVLHNVTINFLAASTADWLKSSIPADAVGGGFTSRIVFIYQKNPSKLILFDESEEERRLVDNLRTDLIFDLNQIRSEIKGVVTFTPEAKRVAMEWYQQEHRNTHEPKLDGYFGRKHDTMFKIATCMSAAESNILVVEGRHITRALEMLNENETYLSEIMDNVMSTQAGVDVSKVLSLIQRHQPIDHAKLLQKCWRFAKSDDMNKILSTLLESKEILCKMTVDGKTRIYKINKEA